ncbi:MAG: hypothetical protein L6R00_01080 [Phycisphaerae bacterium]|nr:hypothetical protein [Phycisphaerae bacterium]
MSRRSMGGVAGSDWLPLARQVLMDGEDGVDGVVLIGGVGPRRWRLRLASELGSQGLDAAR